MAKTKSERLPVKFPKAVASYCHLYQPQEDKKGNEKYSVMLVWTPELQNKGFKKMKKALVAWMESIYGPEKDWPKKLKFPLRDGNEKMKEDAAEGKKPNPIYKDAVFCNVAGSADRGAPQVVQYNEDDELEPCRDLYSGCIVRVTGNWFTFDTDGNRGVAGGLGNVLKVADGPRLDGRARAEDEFSKDDLE